MLKNHLVIAFRNQKKNKVFSFINMLGLSIGISACLVIWLIASFEFSFDTFHPDKERIYRVVSDFTFSGEAFYNGGVRGAMPRAVREEFTGLESVSALHQVNMKAMVTDRKGNVKTFDETKTAIIDPQYFEIFKYEWLEGNPKAALNEPFKVVLTEKEVRRYFGEESLKNVMGKTIDYANFSDTLSFTVSGIIKDWIQNSDFTFSNFIHRSAYHLRPLPPCCVLLATRLFQCSACP